MDVLCPHCGNHRIVQSKVPKDVVVVLPCPSCHELVVLYRNRVIALSREIIEHGTFEERKMHIAGVIADFLEGLFPHQDADSSDAAESEEAGANPSGEFDPAHRRLEHFPEPQNDEAPAPIRQSEIDHFVKFDLGRIDDAAYFKKHFN